MGLRGVAWDTTMRKGLTANGGSADYMSNIGHEGKPYHDATFLFFNLIDEKGHWR